MAALLQVSAAFNNLPEAITCTTRCTRPLPQAAIPCSNQPQANLLVAAWSASEQHTAPPTPLVGQNIYRGTAKNGMVHMVSERASPTTRALCYHACHTPSRLPTATNRHASTPLCVTRLSELHGMSCKVPCMTVETLRLEGCSTLTQDGQESDIICTAPWPHSK